MSAPAGLELPRRRTRYKRRRWPWIVGFLLLLALLLLADAAWSGVQAAQALQDTKDELQAGASALENGDVPTAQNDFGAASSHATAAVNALAHPGPQVLAHVPWLGHNVDAVQRLSRAAQLSAQAGSALTNAADAAGWSGDNLPGFSAGHLDPSVIEKAAPGLAEAALLMAEASQEVEPVDPASLLGPLRDPATQVKDEVTTKAALAGKLAQAAAVLPQMLGADGPRTYLVVSLNTSDPRGSSGYAGAYSVMRVQDGTFSLTKFKPTGTIPRVPPVAAPEEVVKRWKDSGSLSYFIDTTYPPDFPTAGMLMTEIWQAAGRPPVDGVLAADPHFMAELLQVLGPVDTPAWPETITADNVVQILTADTFKTDSYIVSDRWQNTVGDALWQALLTRPWPPRTIGEAFAKAARERHLFVYATDPAQETRLKALGVAGQVQFPPSPDPLVIYEGFTSSRVGYYADLSTTTKVTPRSDGSREVTLTVTLHNRAPAHGPISILLGGKGTGAPYGFFGSEVHVYLPPGAKVGNVTTNGEVPVLEQEQHEFGRTVVVTTVQAKAQKDCVTVVHYVVPA